MTTALDIVTYAARGLGYLGRTDVLSAADGNDGLFALNAMLDSLAGEELMSYASNTQSFTLVIGQSAYTIGSGGNINTTRPIDIPSAYLRDSNSLDYPIQVIPQDRWDAIGQKTITSQIPDTLFYDSQYPLGIINIFPVPLVNYTIFYESIIQQTQFATLSATLAMPPGYLLMYIQNLQVQMISMGFPNMLGPNELATLMENARTSKANVKRNNIKEVIANYDPAIVSRSYATYNIYSDSPARG